MSILFLPFWRTISFHNRWCKNSIINLPIVYTQISTFCSANSQLQTSSLSALRINYNFPQFDLKYSLARTKKLLQFLPIISIQYTMWTWSTHFWMHNTFLLFPIQFICHWSVHIVFVTRMIIIGTIEYRWLYTTSIIMMIIFCFSYAFFQATAKMPLAHSLIIFFHRSLIVYSNNLLNVFFRKFSKTTEITEKKATEKKSHTNKNYRDKKRNQIPKRNVEYRKPDNIFNMNTRNGPFFKITSPLFKWSERSKVNQSFASAGKL